MTDLDIVILSWNRAELTIETINSVLLQNGVTFTIWVVDQGSREDNLTILRQATKHPNVHLIEKGKNLGVPGGRNVGMRLGNARYIVCIDNDAIFQSNESLKRIVERFEKTPQIGIIGFRIKNFYTSEDDDLWWAYPKAQKVMREEEFLTTRYSGCGHAIRRSVFEKVGGYDENLFFYWEEVDFSNQAINFGYQIIYYPMVVVLHKVSPETRIRWDDNRYYYLVRNAIYLRYKYYRNIPDTFVLAVGYLIKGAFNLILNQALRGVLDSVKMCSNNLDATDKNRYILNSHARLYIQEHENRFRGNLLSRMRSEVFVKLLDRA
jgi:GT2 family glycosyltransferase